MRLSYNTVFNRFAVSAYDKLASISYDIYKNIRLPLSRWIPLKEHEKYSFQLETRHNDISSKMPDGYNLISHVKEEGYINLEYIDIFDYLPKENIHDFKKSLRSCVKRNKLSLFGGFLSHARFDDIDDMGQFYSSPSFYNLLSIKLTKNDMLSINCSQLSISLRNLSTSFLLVKYRFYVTDDFNKTLNAVCKTDYEGYNTISRQFNVPWYRPMKFGRSFWDGDNARTKELYSLITSFKWKAFKEIRKTFKICFWTDHLFPPVFETYSTNIRPSSERKILDFWHSVMFGSVVDYSVQYNSCVCWDYKHSSNEGNHLSAYCGGDFTRGEHISQIAQHELADIYAVYLVSQSMNNIAKRDIALCNQKISSAMRTQRTHKMLKTRVIIEKKLYYSRRFINEFSGETIGEDNAEFRNPRLEKGSITSRTFNQMPHYINETKRLVDNILNLSNDAAEYRSSKSNITAQWVMLIITALSLFIAVISIIENAESIGLVIRKWMDSFTK